MKNTQFASWWGVLKRTDGLGLVAGCLGEARRGLRRDACLTRALLVSIVFVVSGCGTTAGQDPAEEAQRIAQKSADKAENEALNQQLAATAVRGAADNQSIQREYPVGPGDKLDISVFGVDDFDSTVRVEGDGSIILPGVGEMMVGGKTLREVEAVVTERLTEFMHSPQVSVSVAEFQSQQISVTGAVRSPALHTITRPRTILELLSMSGGLGSNAGNQVYVQQSVGGESRRLVIDLKQVLSNPNSEAFSMFLKGGDSVFVPEAGVVFVEGAVESPGAYSLKGGAGLIEAITLAGGEIGVARTSDIQVVTVGPDDKRESISVDLDELREDRSRNVALKDGDVVFVPTSGTKSAMSTTWDGVKAIFSFGIGGRVNLFQ